MSGKKFLYMLSPSREAAESVLPYPAVLLSDNPNFRWIVKSKHVFIAHLHALMCYDRCDGLSFGADSSRPDDKIACR